MIFKDCYPSQQLQAYVQVFRLRHFIIPDNLTITPKPYPTRPEQCMTFYIRGFELTEIVSNGTIIKRPRSLISGQYTQRINRYSGSAELLMIQVVFLPGVLHRITGIPFHLLQDQLIDLESVFPKEATIISEQLANCDSYAAMLQAVEQFLLDRIAQPKLDLRPADAVFRFMLHAPTEYSIDWLAKEACLSPRQFERKCNDYLGTCPKFFTRIARFIQSYDMRQKHKTTDWLSIAVACNYHDYQHLVRDYKAFADATPKELFTAESNALERKLGLLQD